jgi:hypothetical protein
MAAIEAKAAAGPLATIAGGYLAWALIYFVPGLDHVFPPDIKGQLPFMFAGLLAAAAGYYAPHTTRPDLAQSAPELPGDRGAAASQPHAGQLPGAS